MPHHSIWTWVLFVVGILALLALDLGAFHRRSHTVSVKEGALWSVFWIALALLFNAGIYVFSGAQPALEFLTGYLIEKSLSVDNIFVIVTIFSYFGVPSQYQHRVLFWGILGALVMRGLFIGVGAVLLAKFHWVIYLLGALLVVTGVRMAVREEKPFDAEQNPAVRLTRRLFPVTSGYRGTHFLVHEAGRLAITPLALALIVVEFTDVLFAVDSIPAIFAVTRDPFIVFTSNVFAILGLRSLYFVLAGAMAKLHLLRYGLAAILSFVGMKMLIAEWYTIPVLVSLGVIAALLAVTVVLSLKIRPREAAGDATHD
jgi:tellurite resistance protein TerC